MTRRYSPEQRQAALDLYLAHGAAEASRRCGVAAPTIRQWAKRAGLTDQRREQARAAVTSARLTWAQRRGELVTRAGEAAERFLEDAIASDSPRKSRDLMASFAMAVDRAQLLDGGATERIAFASTEERREWIRQKRDELAARREAKLSHAKPADMSATR